VVAGAFVFSDLVMMKYLAFGLIAALLLDATVIRMFLVPAVMKLLGDDCWWAPRWMKRLQERIGLGEVELPDERKRPTAREPEGALVGAGAPARPLPPHDPTHPAVEGSSRPSAAARVEQPPPRANAPSGAGTTRIPTPRSAPAAEPPTTRISTARNAVKNAVNNATAATQRTHRAAPPPPREEREIESWLGELRGNPASPVPPPPRPQPSADATRAIPEQGAPPAGGGRPRPRSAPQHGGRGSEPTTAIPVPRPGVGNNAGANAGGDATTAIPVQRPQDPDATEKINTREGDDEGQRRRGGGLSAQDLLRREGRL
jgi:RND superfamily putative drug exporter